MGQDEAAGHSVLGNPPSTGYTVFPGMDTSLRYNSAPLNSTCSSNRTAPNVTDVNSCSNYNSGLGICCLDAGPYTVSGLEAGRPFEPVNSQPYQCRCCCILKPKILQWLECEEPWLGLTGILSSLLLPLIHLAAKCKLSQQLLASVQRDIDADGHVVESIWECPAA